MTSLMSKIVGSLSSPWYESQDASWMHVLWLQVFGSLNDQFAK